MQITLRDFVPVARGCLRWAGVPRLRDRRSVAWSCFNSVCSAKSWPSDGKCQKLTHVQPIREAVQSGGLPICFCPAAFLYRARIAKWHKIELRRENRIRLFNVIGMVAPLQAMGLLLIGCYVYWAAVGVIAWLQWWKRKMVPMTLLSSVVQTAAKIYRSPCYRAPRLRTN